MEPASVSACASDRTVAVIGAGIAGLTAARTLADHGLTVRVVDKGRGPGGRASTRRHDDYQFDHGAQYFTARDDRFRRHVASWIRDGIAAPWQGRIAVADGGQLIPKDGDTHRYVGTPGMSSIAHHLAADLDVTYGTRVEQIARDNDRWLLRDADSQIAIHADVLLVTAPPPQSIDLLATANVRPDLIDRLRQIRMRPCQSAMIVFPERIGVEADGLFIHNNPLSWAARDSSKPGREGPESWVLHASPDWSEAHLEDAPDDVLGALVGAFRAATRAEFPEPTFGRAHRWRFALADDPIEEGCLWDASFGLGVFGDWSHGSRIEGAFLSGKSAAGHVLGLPDPGARADIV